MPDDYWAAFATASSGTQIGRFGMTSLAEQVHVSQARRQTAHKTYWTCARGRTGRVRHNSLRQALRVTVSGCDHTDVVADVTRSQVLILDVLVSPL